MEKTNKIYARLDENDIVIKIFSDVFETALDTDVLIEEGFKDYHAHVHLKYQVMDEQGRYNYKYLDNSLVTITEEEKESFIETPQPSDGEILLSTILLENAKLKQQIAEQQELSATILLELAKIKGGN